MTTKGKSLALSEARDALHPNCIICSRFNPRGLQLDFAFDEIERCITAEFQLDGSLQGYPGTPHGGVISSVFDAAMGNWLFANGLAGVTAELKMKFRHPIKLETTAAVKAWLNRGSHPLYLLEAHIVQEGQIKAWATGKFMHKPELADPDKLA